MKILHFLPALLALTILLLPGCKKDSSSDEFANNISTAAASKKAGPIVPDKPAVNFAAIKARLPADAAARVQLNSALLLKQHPEYKYMLLRALKAVPATTCNDNTMLTQWLDQQLADWDSDVIFFALVTGMLDFPTYDALLFENGLGNQSFGLKGEYTHAIVKTFKDLKRFWNIETDGMVVVPLHGSMLLNRSKIIRIDQILYDDDEATAAFWADLILSLMDEVPQYRKGAHPYFTFNAFAQNSFEFPPYGTVPDKIVMGDGIMDAYVGIGYGDVAPQAILAHEFGHHIQFQLGLFGDETGPEATRRTELMADAFSAYYLSHARGASMQWKRVKLFLQVFFNIGDCSLASDGHHGTPAQRMAAAEWGYSVANNAQKQGHILSAGAFAAMFDAQLPAIIAH